MEKIVRLDLWKFAGILLLMLHLGQCELITYFDDEPLALISPNPNSQVPLAFGESLSQNPAEQEDIFSGDDGLPDLSFPPETNDGTIILDPNEDNLESTVPQENNGNIEIITNEPVETEKSPGTQEENTGGLDATTLSSNIPECLASGPMPNMEDCHKYFLCSNTTLEGFEALPMNCPPRMAFNSALKRCSRDISDCEDNLNCILPGNFPVPDDNTTFLMCSPASVGGYHKFLVKCPQDQYFMPNLGVCFYDLDNLPLVFGFEGPKDMDVIKLELKQIKKEEKLQMKAEKMKLKMEEKLKKEQEKQAKKDAKAKAKLVKTKGSASEESLEKI